MTKEQEERRKLPLIEVSKPSAHPSFTSWSGHEKESKKEAERPAYEFKKQNSSTLLLEIKITQLQKEISFWIKCRVYSSLFKRIQRDFTGQKEKEKWMDERRDHKRTQHNRRFNSRHRLGWMSVSCKSSASGFSCSPLRDTWYLLTYEWIKENGRQSTLKKSPEKVMVMMMVNSLSSISFQFSQAFWERGQKAFYKGLTFLFMDAGLTQVARKRNVFTVCIITMTSNTVWCNLFSNISSHKQRKFVTKM